MPPAINEHKYECCQWDVVNIPFTATKVPTEPFNVTFGATFTGPRGQVLTVPGFYDGDRNYTIRFSPPVAGTWEFTTFASLPSLVNYQGEVRCSEQKNPQQHGPMVVDRINPQRFAYADGTPYFLIAFECDWLFALDCENADGIPRTQQLVDQITAMGFNHVVMNVYAHDVTWKKDPNVMPEHEFGAPGLYPFGGTNDAPDFSTLNVTYFQRLDRVIDYMNQRGVTAHLMIYVWNKLVSWPPMYSVMDNTFYDYVITRYQAFPNVVWDVSKEALGYGRCDMEYVLERIHRTRHLDAHRRLLTVHDYAFCAKYPEAVDFISIQVWCTDLYRRMLEVGENHVDKPVFNIEHGGYEKGPYVVFTGDYIDARTCLERNYACLFAGTYSTYYWQCTSWNVIIPSPMALPDRQKPKFSYYYHMAALFKRYNFNQFYPLITHHSSGMALSNGDGTCIYAIPKENYAIHVSLPESLGKRVMVNWFNPYSGEYVVAGLTEAQMWHEFVSPWVGQMAVLILEKGKA